MAQQLSATFVPGGFDDYYMPDVVSPAPQRITPQVPQIMQDGLQRLELEARESSRNVAPEASSHQHDRQSSISSARQEEDPYATATGNDSMRPPRSAAEADGAGDITAYKASGNRLDTAGRDAPSFSPFPNVTGDNIPPADDAKEDILWSARSHVLHSQNVNMQISWARDVLIWVEIAMDAMARETAGRVRPPTPRIEHELRVDALNIISYLAEQEHPEALYIRSKWLEFGKFGHRVDKREAFSGYKRASELGNARSEYRMGMLFEQSNDMSKAKEHYYRGMSLKDSAALYRMGMMSLLGQHGESRDYVRGLERIRSAADGSDEDAPQGAYVYGMLLGRDLPDISIPDGLLAHNLDTARMYVEKAAYLGFAKAQLKMGQAYELCQLGCEFNPSFSLHYYGLASRQGVPEASLGVSRWFLFGYEGVFKKNEELAFKYAEEAADAGLATGEFAMGYYYEIGIHVNRSIPDARKWYQIAADHGNTDALGRLDSLHNDQSLSKQDHETTTLTRIKSQHGSQSGKRPERFKQPQQMDTLDEAPSNKGSTGEGWSSTASQPFAAAAAAATAGRTGRRESTAGGSRVSPQPSPAINHPATIVPDHVSFPDPSRAMRAGTDRPSAFSIRLDGDTQAPPRSHSAAPYPDDDWPVPLSPSRSRTAVPYPDDDVKMPAEMGFGPGLNPLRGPHPERTSSAFGIKGLQIPTSHSTGNLQPPGQPGHPRGRVVSAGMQPRRPVGGYNQPGPGRQPGGQRPGAPPTDAYGRLASSQSLPGAANMAANRPPNQQQHRQPHPQGMPRIADPAGREHGRNPPRMGPEGSMPQDARIASQNYERMSRVPGTTGRPPERLTSLPGKDAPQRLPLPQSSSGHASLNPPRPAAAAAAAGGRVGSAPPGMPGQQRPSGLNAGSGPGPTHAATAPAKPSKGPATFEDMGITPGKEGGDCVVM